MPANPIHRRRAASLVIVLLWGVALAGCGDAPSGGGGEFEEETIPEEETFTTVSVDVLEVLIAPVKVDGAPWDGLGGGSEATLREVGSILGGLSGFPALGEALTLINYVSNTALAKPDPIGSVEIDFGRGWTDTMRFDSGEDTFLAAINTSHSGYPYGEVRLRLELKDEDVVNDDNIGLVIISREHIREAVRRGEAIWIKTATSAADQILLVKIAAQGYR